MISKTTWAIPIDTLGVPARFTQTKPPNTVLHLRKIGIATASKEDSQLIDSIGFGGKILTIKGDDLAGLIPIRFDTLQVNGKDLIIDSVHEVLEPGTGQLCGYRCFVKG